MNCTFHKRILNLQFTLRYNVLNGIDEKFYYSLLTISMDLSLKKRTWGAPRRA